MELICISILMYTVNRCTTVRYSTTLADTIGGKTRHVQVARKLLEVLLEMNLYDNPVLFHIFSNEGCKIYNAMRDELRENSHFEDIVKLGVVYDSAPGQPEIRQQVAAVIQTYDNNWWTSLLKMAVYAYTAVTVGLDVILSYIGVQLRSYMYNDMIYYQDGCPELYLFSKADELVSASDIQNLIERRRMQGVDIDFVAWDDSPHVQHLQEHRESYVSQCHDFLRKCLLAAEGDDAE